jgi:TonB family protein
MPIRRVTSWTLLPIVAVALAVPAAAQPVPVTNWLVTRPTPGIKTEGGILRMSSSGWLRAQPATLDYILRLEFRAASEDAEGAVLLRAYALRPGESPGTGYRVALHGSSVRKPLGEVTGIGDRVRERERSTALTGSPVGNWRQIEIRADGNQLTVAIDGQVVRNTETSEAFAGYVGLEARRGVLEFRSVTIESLRPIRCPEATEDDSTVIRMGDNPDVQGPKLKRSVRPRYTPDAMLRGAMGTVRLQGVVRTDGTVDRVCVTRPVDPDLDVQAIAAAKQFLFEPGRRGDVPVYVLVSFEIEFTLGR